MFKVYQSVLTFIITVRYLKFKQIFYRIYYYFKNIFPFRGHSVIQNPHENITPCFLHFITHPIGTNHFDGSAFIFLNKSCTIDTLDWNYKKFGKLWNYNLNYFEFLNDEKISKETGERLINNFLKSIASLKDGMDPYPTSLRLMNWVKFLSINEIHDAPIINSVYSQTCFLLKNVEYHLMGNHLLENGFAIYLSGLFLRNSKFIKRGEDILVSELNEQILDDGGHFELSPMYHQIILFRLLDTINILQNTNELSKRLLPFFENKAKMMLRWISEISFSSGRIPLFNDSAEKIAPATTDLLNYGQLLGLKLTSGNFQFTSSGYRKFKGTNFEIVVDIGKIGPDYIPGHAHADMLSFEMESHGKPFIVDTGISTYEIGQIRNQERSTSAHNTIQVGNLEQSEMWASHRVGRRAKISVIRDATSTIHAQVEGYYPQKAYVSRTFSFHPEKIEISDNGNIKKNRCFYTFFHFHPDVNISIQQNVALTNLGSISFSGHEKIELLSYDYAAGFNLQMPSKYLKIAFFSELISIIEI